MAAYNEHELLRNISQKLTLIIALLAFIAGTVIIHHLGSTWGSTD